MILNYFKIAVRNILRHKVYSIINIAGLSVGMACTILILLWVQYELSFDCYHENAGRIFRLAVDIDFGKMRGKFAISNYIAGLALKADYPEVLEAVRFQRVRDKVSIQYNSRKFYGSDIFIVDNSIFDIFTFPLIRGDPKTALKSPFSIVISEEEANAVFGDENPIGKVFNVENKYDFTVTGVIKSVPRNSHFRFDVLVSFETLNHLYGERKDEIVQNWLNHDNYTYLLLQEGFDYKKLEEKFPAFIEKHTGEKLRALGGKLDYFLQPLTSIHLHSDLDEEITENKDISYIYVSFTIALFILFIACINFMNLSTARSAGRTTEVGIRRALGATRSQLIIQFFGESFLISFIALILALCIIELILPTFRSLSGSHLSLNIVSLPWLFMGLTGFPLFVGMLAGSYPATFLSSFQPVQILKGKMRTGPTGSRFRRIMVLVQFSISIALIAGTGIVFSQLNYMKEKKLGFNREYIVVIPFGGNSIRQSIDHILTTLTSHSQIREAAASSNIPGQLPARHLFVPEGFNLDQSQMMDHISISPNFIPTMGIKIAAGRNFSSLSGNDDSDTILINEESARRFGWDNPVGKTIRNLSDNKTKKIIGVVRDFHLRSLHYGISPLYIDYVPSRFRFISIKLIPGDISKTLAFLNKKWQEIDPEHTFEYFFLDKTFDSQYKAEDRLIRIFSYFTFLAIFIGCSGLFGLSSYTSEQRTKEIGIRKALGASISGITLLLSKEFTKWVLMANLIAWPLAYLAMNRWLQNFAYRINIGLGTFVLSALLAFIIALLTVGYQAVKAARANPVDALRYE